MPELPEVETILRGLRPAVAGARITGVEVIRPDVLPQGPDALRRGLPGRRIEALERRGKNLVFRLQAPGRLVVNLGMTGRLLLSGASGQESRHPAVRLRLAPDSGGGGTGSGGSGRRPATLVYDDVRRFGTLELLTDREWRERSRTLGPEPLDRGFTSRALLRALERSRSPIRSWLLDQRRVAGVGNIYANEALYRAGIDPRRPARTLDPVEVRALHRGLRRVLRGAITAGGTTIRDYRNAAGGRGSYGGRLAVYGRAGEACHRCDSPIRRVVFGGRSAFFCPLCQGERT